MLAVLYKVTEILSSVSRVTGSLSSVSGAVQEYRKLEQC